MDLKFLVCLFFIFLSISISISTSTPSNQVQENHIKGSLIHGVANVGMTTYDTKNEDGDQESFITYVKKRSHGTGGGESSSIHHSRRNRASSLSTHSSFVFPCIVFFGLILFPIV